MGERFAAEKRDPFDSVISDRSTHLSDDVVKRRLGAAFEAQHLRIAAARTAQWATLKPQREASARSLGFRRGNNLSNLQ